MTSDTPSALVDRRIVVACAASARASPTARVRSTGSISTCAPANSSRCSVRPAAASRRRCGSIAGLSEPTDAARSSGRQRRRRQARRYRLRVSGADPDALGDGRRQCRAAAASCTACRRRARRGTRVARRARARRARRFRQALSARTVRRHEDARLDRARARDRAAAPADGRAVRGARRDHALQAQRRSAGAVAATCAATVCSSPIRCSSRCFCRPASW